MRPTTRATIRLATGLLSTALLVACSTTPAASTSVSSPGTASVIPTVLTSRSTPTSPPLASIEPSPSAAPGLVGTIDVGSGPCALETSPDGRAFVSLYNDGTIAMIDPTTLIVKQLASVGGSPCGVAWIDGTLWVAQVGSNSLVDIDPASARQIRTVALKGSPWDLQPGAGALWVVDRGIPGVARIDPKTGRIVASVKTAGTPVGLAIVGSHPWVAGYGPAELDRINEQGSAIDLRTTVGLGPAPTWFADGGGSLWVADNGGGMTRIDPSSGKVVASVPLPGVPRDPVVAFGALWVANSSDGVLSRIDLTTNQVSARIQLQPGIWVVEQVGKEIWVENFSGTQIDRIDPTLVK